MRADGDPTVAPAVVNWAMPPPSSFNNSVDYLRTVPNIQPDG
jgi:hypothetical protein